MSADARADVLRRIREANRRSLDLAAAEQEGQTLPRNYRRSTQGTHAETLALFEERLLDYDAHVLRAAAPDVPRAVADALTQAHAKRVLLPSDLPLELPPDFVLVRDTGLTPAELDAADAVVTRCALGIAETGTLVLQTAPGQGRRAATLVPDVHVCIIRAGNVVATVPEAMDRLQATHTLPTTFVSGPSATADIEMTRIKGVHGPRFLYVVLEGEPSALMDTSRIPSSIEEPARSKFSTETV